MNTDSAYFITSDGVRLHYLEAGQGKPLVMLPGWTQSAKSFSKQFAALSGSFRCLALDFRGHGESERPTYGYRVSRFAHDCFEFLNYLCLENAILLGHSAGCAVIWDFIDLFGEDRLHALILCDQPITFLKRPGWSETECHNYGALIEGNDALAQADAIAGSGGETVFRDFLSNMFSPEFSKSEIERVVAGSLRMPLSAAADLMISVMQTDFRDLLPRIRRPVLCIGGKRSHLGPRVMPWISSRIPNSQLAMIDAQHFVHLEKPNRFNEEIQAFLSQIEAVFST